MTIYPSGDDLSALLPACGVSAHAVDRKVLKLIHSKPAALRVVYYKRVLTELPLPRGGVHADRFPSPFPQHPSLRGPPLVAKLKSVQSSVKKGVRIPKKRRLNTDA